MPNIDIDRLECAVREDGHLLLDMDEALALIERVRRAEGVAEAAREFYDATIASGPDSPDLTDLPVHITSGSRAAIERADAAADSLESALRAFREADHA